MANAIKYNTSAETLALKSGNFWIGTGDVGKGPTSETGYYNGITPPSGGYTIYLNKASGGPSIYTCANDSELISLTNQIAGTSYTTANECLVYFAGQTDKICLNRDYEDIVTDGLVLNLDPGLTPSYPKNGTTWYDISSSTSFTLTNGPTYSSNNGGILQYDGTNDTAIYSSAPPASWDPGNDGAFSWGGWINLTAKSGFSQWLRFSNYFFYFQTSSQFMRLYYPSSVDMYFTIDTGVWKYWMAVMDRPNNVIYIYKNGSLIHTQLNATSSGGIGTGDSSIGDEASGGEAIGGSMGPVQYYTKALTSDEVLQNFNAQKSRFGL